MILTKPIRAQDSFLVAIEKLRNSGLEALPVIEGSEIVGIVDRSTAFERLAEAVVQARLKA